MQVKKSQHQMRNKKNTVANNVYLTLRAFARNVRYTKRSPQEKNIKLIRKSKNEQECNSMIWNNF